MMKGTLHCSKMYTVVDFQIVKEMLHCICAAWTGLC